MSDLDEIRSKVFAELNKPPLVPRWELDATRLAVLSMGLVALGVGVGATIGYPAQVARWPGALFSLATIAVGAIVAVRPSSRAWRFAFLGVALVFLACSMFARDPSGAPGEGLECIVVEWGVSIGPGLGTVYVLRRFAFRPIESLVGGLAAGAAGVAVLELSCPEGTVGHLVAYHLIPWAMLAVAFLWLRARSRSRTFAP